MDSAVIDRGSGEFVTGLGSWARGGVRSGRGRWVVMMDGWMDGTLLLRISSLAYSYWICLVVAVTGDCGWQVDFLDVFYPTLVAEPASEVV